MLETQNVVKDDNKPLSQSGPAGSLSDSELSQIIHNQEDKLDDAKRTSSVSRASVFYKCFSSQVQSQLFILLIQLARRLINNTKLSICSSHYYSTG